MPIDTNKWNKENPEKKIANDRDWNDRKKYGEAMRSQYGVDGTEGYNYLREVQNYCCAVCGRTEEEILEATAKKRRTKLKGKPMPALVHEHCHESGRIRGLVCNRCNKEIQGYETLVLRFGCKERMKEYFND